MEYVSEKILELLDKVSEDRKELYDVQYFLIDVQGRIERQTKAEVYAYIHGVYIDELERSAGGLLCAYAFALLNALYGNKQ